MTGEAARDGGTYTGTQLDRDVAAIVACIVRQPSEVDTLDTVALATAIGAGQPHVLGALCANVTAGAWPLRLTPVDHLVPHALQIVPSETALMVCQAMMQTRGGHSSRINGAAHYLRVTAEGLRYIGEYDYPSSNTHPVAAGAVASG